jgi:hypothetical protein
MSADNYVIVRKFGKSDFRWGEWSASDNKPDYSNDKFDNGPFKTPLEAANNANMEIPYIEYGIQYEPDCLAQE